MMGLASEYMGIGKRKMCYLELCIVVSCRIGETLFEGKVAKQRGVERACEICSSKLLDIRKRMYCCKGSEALGLPLCIICILIISSVVFILAVEKAAFPNRVHLNSVILI